MKPAVMSDLETQLQPRSGEQIVSTLRVEVVDGPDRGKHVVGGDVVSVGTARDNVLAVGDFTVSRYHLDVSVRPGGIVVTDLGSTNGTYIAHAGGPLPTEPLTPNQAVELETGDRILIGGHTRVVILPEAPAATPAP